MPHFIDDKAPIGSVVKTAQGYLATEALTVRTGIQDYLGSEVGMPEKAIVRVYRPAEEVFNKDSLRSFAHLPLTLDHPPGGVDAETWKERAVGEVSTDVIRDGERIKFALIVKDSKAIKEIEDSSRRELSAGYTCDLDPTPGTTPDGQPYDMVQRNIRGNHVAIVRKGRAGADFRIGDAASWVAPVADNEGATRRSQGAEDMDFVTLVIDGKPVRVAKDDAGIVTAFVATQDAALGTKDAEITDLRAKVIDDAEIDRRVASRVALLGDASKKAPKVDFKDASSELDIMKLVVADRVPGIDLKDKSIDYVRALFDNLTAVGGTVVPVGTDPLRAVVGDMVPPADLMADEQAAYDDYIKGFNKKPAA